MTENGRARHTHSRQAVIVRCCLKSDKVAAEAVRKSLYCTEVDQTYDDGSRDFLYKFMNNDELHEFCGDKNYDGYADEKDKGIILKFEPDND